MLLAPAMLVIVVVTIYPMINSFLLSFQDWRLQRSDRPAGFVGFDQYVRAFNDPYFLNSIIVTIEFTIISVAMTIVIGLAMALVLQKRSPLNQLIRSLLIFPFAVSAVLKGYSFSFMLNQNYGIIHVIIATLIPAAKDIVWLAEPGWALFWIAVTEVWGWAPLYALMFIGALGSISPEIFEAAKVDGATYWSVFWHVTLPLLTPVLVIATLLKTIFSLKIFDQVVAMTGGGPGRATQTINYYVYQTAFRNLNLGYSAALAYILVVGLAFFAYFYVRALYRDTGVKS
jgi:multiple sugar transport system permease protein